MTLTNSASFELDTLALPLQDLVRLRCSAAKEFEEAGNYEAACGALAEWWESPGQHPKIEGLEADSAAELLLRAGVLTGFIGGSKQIPNAHEIAKDLISESIRLFDSLENVEKVEEAQAELGFCYSRAGAYDDARVILSEVLARIAPENIEQRATTLLRSAIVEACTTRYSDALRLLAEAEPLFEASRNSAHIGQFHMERGIVLEALSTGEQREDYADRALMDYTAASIHFEQAGHLRFYARVENNLGFLYFKLARYADAHEHLNRARQLFTNLDDSGSAAQVEDTSARVFLGQKENAEAERIARRAAQSLEHSGQPNILAEALTTRGTALARLGKQSEARTVLQRAFEVAEQAGDLEGAGVAELTTLEELGDHLTSVELRAIYELADHLLTRTQHPGILERLRACARRVIAAERTHNIEFETAGFAYGSEQTATLLRGAHSIARSQGAVLLTGETGTGKELLARLMHEWSGRPGQFVAINCAALSETLLESQLFGHVKGSFTDAVEDYPGAARLAAGGTLFLDEIAELSAANQSKLLRFIEYGEIHTVGASTPERIDVRVMAATNRVIEDEIAAGRFRRDLFYRLQNFHLELPPLRTRVEDVPAIAEHFIREAMRRQGKRVRFTPGAIEAMCRLPLPGNARELRSLIERTLLAASNGSSIEADAVETVALRLTGKADFADPWANFSLKEEVQRFEEHLIEKALRDAQGKVSNAARLLGFKHHESLNWRLKNRNKNLLAARTPAKQRKRSIIKNYQPKRG
ncbi:MAG TPA: sigma 54-interacting transcriptional regulator [Pyrinomonadaceae bacterium]|jgi:transcriptional regulator with PAS, ATPase and Fis domain|nr:sigma 54-interacting transcriptional regulator [Pyrinomonadaceae bacterium]